MKKLKPIFLAVFIGVISAYSLFKNISKDDYYTYNAYAIQIGVFTRLENAEKMQENLGGIIIEDGDLYRVYYSVLTKESNILFFTNYLENEGINYYLKEIVLDDDMLNLLDDYEVLMEQTSNEIKLEVNNELLRKYEEVI